MSRRRKGVVLHSLQQEVEPPGAGQCIVMALGTRGGNIVEVQHPCGRQTLSMLPARFNKKLWVRRGGYLIIEDSPEASAEGGAITGTIVAVLYEEHVKQLRKLPGVWPPEFEAPPPAASAAEPGSDGGSRSDDGGLPPLRRINNRQVVAAEESDTDTGEGEEEEGEQGQGAAAAQGEGGGG